MINRRQLTAQQHNNLGITLANQNKLDQAIDSFQQAIKLKPKYAEAHYNLGLVLEKKGKLNKAIVNYKQALVFKPKYAEAHNNLGAVLANLGKLDQAIKSFQQAIKLKPKYAEAHYNLGLALKNQGHLNAAIASFKRSLKINPDNPEVHNTLGNALANLGKLKSALKSFQQALTINPNFAKAHNDLGNIFLYQEKLDKALACYQRALSIDPQFAQAHANLGSVQEQLGQLDQALVSYQRALKINPHLTKSLDNVCFVLQHLCQWDKLKKLMPKLYKQTSTALAKGLMTAETPFFNVATCDNLRRNLQVARSWSLAIQKDANFTPLAFSFKTRLRPKKKIRLGYLSSDFYNHPTVHLMLSLFKLHNRNQFETFVYSCGPDDGSHYRTQIQADADCFIDISQLDLDKAARQIFKDKIDILIDLKGHTKSSRLKIAALGPAPIQVAWLGFPGTSGADFFDYIITDKIVTPPKHAKFYTEKFVFMPHCYQVNDCDQPIADKKITRADFGLPKKEFVFACFSRNYKIDAVMFAVWMNILKAVPQSVLWLLEDNSEAPKNLKKHAQKRGINPKRLIFAKKIKKDLHLARHRLADLALDTRIYNGHTTTSDALWAGLPVLTLQGKHFASRVASSILTAIGLPELITYSLKEYEETAIQLAKNPKKLIKLKNKLAKNRLTQPLFDTPRFVKDLEKAYQEMWKIYLT